MGNVHPLLLKAAATAFTLVATAASALYVGGHLKNPAAPLHPAVVGGQLAAPTSADGRLHLSPAVRSGDVQPVTSTYAS